MKAVIFAAGIGSRLKPFTDHHPKALAPIGETTALGIVVEKLIRAGADGIVVNVHHFAGQIVDWLASRNYQVDIEISDESGLLLDTGGALAKIWRESRIIGDAADDELVVIHNADILTDAPIDGLVSAISDGSVSLLVDKTRNSSRKLLFDPKGRMSGWYDEKHDIVLPDNINPTEYIPAAFGGIHAMRSSILSDISDYCGARLHPFGIMAYYIEHCKNVDIRSYEPDKPYTWYDLGTPERLTEAQKAFNQGLLHL